MGFLQPLALFGLAAAAIPAILHLLTRRVPPVVPFPAVRYIEETERAHSRRLKLRNLLLLVLRTLLIVLVVLAAARPVVDAGIGRSHSPTAVAVILDNSLSSGAVVEGTRTLDRAVAQARRVLDLVGDDDEVWLVLADGLPRRVGTAEVERVLDALEPEPVRLDLGAAIVSGANAVARSQLPLREVIVISDRQRTAFESPRVVDTRVTFWEPPPPPANHAIDWVRVEPPVWSTAGEVVVALSGVTDDPVAVNLTIEGELATRTVAVPGDEVTLQAAVGRRGWVTGSVSVDADEFRADDRIPFAVLVAEPVATSLGEDIGGFIADAVAVLREGGRLRSGAAVRIDTRLTSTSTILIPPSDPALIGAVNRSLEQADVSWRYADLTEGEWGLEGEVGPATDAVVFKRYRLTGRGEVLATVAGEPWLVRAGDHVILASRFDAAWTDLPVSAAFVPFVDYLVNRLAGPNAWLRDAAPGAPVRLPPGVMRLVGPSGETAVADGDTFVAPAVLGTFFMISGAADTVGVLNVVPDRRESDLAVAEFAGLRASFGDVASSPDLTRVVFRGGSSADLTPVLLVLALVVALTELAAATLGSRRSEL
ncbi:MAG: VWA domain-containing protein [Gemmatimonadales bacterium]